MPDIPEDSITPREARRPFVLGSRQLPHASVFPKRNLMISGSSSGSQRYGKRTIGEMERGSGWPMGQTSSFSWAPDPRRGFQNIAQHSSISNVAPLAHCTNVPGGAMTLMTNMLEQFHMCLQSRMVSPVATCAISPNPAFMMGQAPNNNHETVHTEVRESVLTRFMRDLHCRKQLEIIIRGSLSTWAVQYAARSSDTLPPLASVTVYWAPTAVPVPMSVPIGLPFVIERFIFANLNAAYAQPGEFMVPLPERVRGNGELGRSFLDVIEAEALLDAITELLDESQT